MRVVDVERHPDATLFTEVIPLMHPDCHTPPVRPKAPGAFLGPYREPEAPRLTPRQQEATRVIYTNEYTLQVRDRWTFIQRGSGAPDAGLRITCHNFESIMVVRTSREPTELLPYLAQVGPNLFGGLGPGVSLALDYCPYGAETAEANVEFRFGSPLRSLAESAEMHAQAASMPEDGLFTARHISDVQFTPDGRVRWRDADYGHYFQAEKYIYVFFSLDHVYALAPTRGARGRRAPGLPEPWRIWAHAIDDSVKRDLRVVGNGSSREDAIQALHTALGTTRGPLTHFSWESA